MFHIFLVTYKSLTAKDGIGRVKVATVYSIVATEPVARFLLEHYSEWDSVEVYDDEIDKTIFTHNRQGNILPPSDPLIPDQISAV